MENELIKGMKTPDEIKKGLECCANDAMCSEKCPYFNSLSNGVDCASKMKADALTYTKQLEADNAQQARCIENLTDKLNATNDALPRWISVKEQLPDKNGKYLVHAHHWVEGVKPIIRCSLWLNGKWDKYDAYTVDHWMPLPEPPVEV